MNNQFDFAVLSLDLVIFCFLYYQRGFKQEIKIKKAAETHCPIFGYFFGFSFCFNQFLF